MNAFQLGAVAVQAFGWSLVHFIWQAALVGAVYAAARMVLPRGNPRYIAALLALIVLAVFPAWTFWHELQAFAQPVELGDMPVTGAVGASTVAAVPPPADWMAPLGIALPWLVLAWGSGVALLGVRIARQWRGLRAIVRAAEALPVWQERARRLGLRLGLRRAVRVLASVRIATPTLVGWARPVAVMPLAMLARMPAEQVDLILAHELAHLRRLDHLANLFQVALETLLFYHPVVHWISRDARNERELCCDALALRVSGASRRDFVAALAGLEEFRAEHADLALAATGGVLVERAWFIAGAMPDHRHSLRGLAAALFALLGVLILLAVAWRQNLTQERVEEVLAANARVLRHDLAAFTTTLPAPVWRDGVANQPKLAPVSLVPEPPPAQKAPRLVAPAVSMPALMVSDLAAVSVDVAPVAPLQGAVPAHALSPSAMAAAPRAIHAVAPVYPPQALLNGLQGQVDIQFMLTAAGVPQDLQVVRSSAPGQFDAAALLALSRWRFAPPAEPGRRYRQTFTFRLDAAAGGATAADACLVLTGTHICRHAFDAGAGVRVLRTSH